MLIINPPATAGGTDRVQVRPGNMLYCAVFTTPTESLESYSIFATGTVSPPVFPKKYDCHLRYNPGARV